MLLALAGGLAIGFARGGGLAGIAQLPLRRQRLLVTALGIYVVGVLCGWLWDPALAVLAGLAWLTVAFYAWVNRHVQGATLVAAGLAANGLVLLLNGAVPVSPSAATHAGADPAALVAAPGHEPSAANTLLPWMGKTVPVAFPPRPEVVSPGDVAVAAGLALVVGLGMMRVTRPSVGSTSAGQAGAHETIGAEPEPQRSAVS